MSKKKVNYDESFKKQIVELFKNGKSALEIMREYDISRAAIYNWIKNYNNSGSFKAKDNRTDEEKQLINLEKENKQLRMEVDILKQAALIMGRK